jgi:2-polyprenyl-6-methoxyphenol hydroxylase-like FAD-dependent oxidoreductase
MRSRRDHAVVVGASMAGLLAARALADHFERVTIVERDTLPASDDGRRAVPQGRHAHALLARGHVCMEELLPGLTGELIAAGAPTYEPLAELRFIAQGHQLARARVRRRSIVAGRPLIEGRVRRRVLELANVEVTERSDAVGLTATPGGGRVTGVRVLRRAGGSAEEVLEADLVVAAGGRGARLGAWLEALGHARPAEDRVRVDVAYASRHVRLPDGALGGDRLVLVGARPGLPRGMALFAQEGDRHLLTLFGYGAVHRPPSDDDGFARFAAGVAPAGVGDALATAEPLGEIATHGFPAHVRRRYERVAGFPAGLLVTGDALCSFNPIYGQGMTVAALEASALGRCLADGDEDLAERWFAAVRPIVDHAWDLAAGGDLALPEVAGPRPARVRLTNAYLGRLIAVAEHDAEVALAFISVTGMLAHPRTLLRPALVRRVLAGARAPARSKRPAAARPTTEVAS